MPLGEASGCEAMLYQATKRDASLHFTTGQAAECKASVHEATMLHAAMRKSAVQKAEVRLEALIQAAGRQTATAWIVNDDTPGGCAR